METSTDKDGVLHTKIDANDDLAASRRGMAGSIREHNGRHSVRLGLFNESLLEKVRYRN